MKSLIQKTIFLCFVFLLMQSCTKDNEPCGGNETYNYLSTEDKAKVPYTGTDTLVFVSNTNDTAVCIGQGKKRFYTVKYLSVRAGECQNDAYYYEAYNYKFKDNKNLLDISLNIWKNDLENFEVMEINMNTYKLYPINLSFLTQKYYDDSISVNDKIYPVNKLGSFIKYNLQKGIMYCEVENFKWTLIN